MRGPTGAFLDAIASGTGSAGARLKKTGLADLQAILPSGASKDDDSASITARKKPGNAIIHWLHIEPYLSLFQMISVALSKPSSVISLVVLNLVRLYKSSVNLNLI